MADEYAGKPKAPFFIAIAVVVLGLVGFALWRAGLLFPEGTDGTPVPTIDISDLGGDGPEAPDSSAPTTVKEYAYVPAQKLPEVKGVSGYKKLQDNTVKFSLNVWAGWAPIIYANEGFEPKKVWKTPSGKEFKVELVLIDDPVAMRDAYASGNVHVGWATVDMLPLLVGGLTKDSRAMPRIYQQVDWSNGGDGIVVRENIQSVADLRGKTIVLAQNSPSEYFILNALINGGVQPAEVNFKYTADAFQAAAAFNADKNIAACVSWAPDIYNLSEAKGNRMLVTTGEANRLIADVWYARADFAKDHPEIVEGLVRGIFDAVEALSSEAEQKKAAEWMAQGYGLPADETFAMLGDAHWTNYAENREFFLNKNNPANFERTWDSAYYLYRRIGKVDDKVPFDQVVDFSVIQNLGKDPKYSGSVNSYMVNFVPKTVGEIKAESGEILTKRVTVHFYPNSSDLYHKIYRMEDGKEVETYYDPNVEKVVEEVGRMAGQYGAARIVIEGHTDSSMKGKVPFEAVQQLSEERADSVRKAIIDKFPDINPNQVSSAGYGWKYPADENDPNNHSLNRRVEAKVYPLEASR